MLRVMDVSMMRSGPSGLEGSSDPFQIPPHGAILRPTQEFAAGGPADLGLMEKVATGDEVTVAVVRDLVR